MQTHEQRALLTIALLAAFADGAKHDRERDQIRRIAESLGGPGGSPDLASVYQDVLLKRASATQAAEALTDADHRRLAYEMAVCVCDADGARSEAENGFLRELQRALKIDDADADAARREPDTLAALPLAEAAPAPSRAAGAPAPAMTAPNVPEAELDKTILNHAILAGALELLPQSWASMAIIPVQMKLVYRIGQAWGHQLDQGHVKEFLATAGVGLTSQYLEQFGRKLLGGLLGKVGGGLGRTLGGAATGIAFSFATTYALGQLAKRYYAGGRQMNTAVLRDTFSSLLGPAKQLQAQYLPQIEQRARTLDPAQIVAMVRQA